MTIYTHRIDWSVDNNRLPYVGESVTLSKSLGWSTDTSETKTVVCYSPSDLVPHTLKRGNDDYLFFTVELVNNPSEGKYPVVRVHNSGYTTVSPGMKSQEILSQFI